MMAQVKIELARQKFNLGKIDESRQILEKIRKQKPKGQLLYEIEILEAAINVRNGKVDNALGSIAKLENAFGLKPEIINIKAVGLRAKKHYESALATLKQGVSLFPESFDLVHNLSTTATDLGQYSLGEEYGLKAMNIRPNFVDTIKNLGRIYVTTRNSEKTQEIFEKLELIEGKSVDVLIGYGAAKLIESQYKEAEVFFKQALKINPNLGPAWANLGICQKFAGNFEEARKSLEQARRCEPEQIEHQWNLSLIELALGDYENGWRNYESRYNPFRIAPDRVIGPKTSVPMLREGDSVLNKEIILLQEQGFGDSFQFFRFAKNLKAEGAKKIIAMVGPELQAIIKSIPWVDEVRQEIKQSDGILPDYWIFPMSLPSRYKIQSADKLGDDIPYLKASKDKSDLWRERLSSANIQKARVGLVWAGRNTHSNDKNRSIKLSQLNSLATLEDRIQFISLQKGDAENQESKFGQLNRLGNQIETFEDTAGILANLDLLISVDSAPVHIAGAMGLPTWALIPSIFDFRWMVGREDSPWYPNLRLFRQGNNEDWSAVVDRIVDNLESFLGDPYSYEPHIYNPHPDIIRSTCLGGYELLIRSAYQYQLEGKMQEAIDLYEQSRKIFNDRPEILRNLAAAYRASGDFASAINIYHYAENSGFTDHITYTNFGNLYIQLEDFSRALEQAEVAILKKKNYRMAWEMKALCLERLGRVQESQEALVQAKLCTE
jgi:tetratricopeptide (TPR) repeat protein